MHSVLNQYETLFAYTSVNTTYNNNKVNKTQFTAIKKKKVLARGALDFPRTPQPAHAALYASLHFCLPARCLCPTGVRSALSPAS